MKIEENLITFDELTKLVLTNKLTKENLELYLNTGGNINYKNEYQQTILNITCSYSYNYEIIQLLLEYGADTNIQNMHGETALYKSVYHYKIDFVQLLLEYGADPTIINNNGDNCLNLASCIGNIKAVQLLLEYNKLNPTKLINLNFQNNSKWTPLMYASRNNYIEIVKLLLKYGADPNIYTNSKKTALYWASIWNFMDIVQLLLQFGSKPIIGDNILVNTLSCGHFRMISYLLKQKFYHEKVMKLKKLNLNQNKLYSERIITKF